MKLVAMLIVVLVIGFILYRQMGISVDYGGQIGQSPSEIGPPKVPTNPNQLKSFDKELNDIVRQDAAARAAKIEAVESQ